VSHLLLPGWRADGATEILAALRTLYTYTGREPGRATGWLYSARQIGMLPLTPWPEVLAEFGPVLLYDLEMTLGVRFEAACFQAYLDGSGCGWHYDRDWPVQAILSLGVTRSFGLRRIDGTREEALRLAHGDLLYTPAPMQAEWEHRVPVEDVTGERCSIVFRSAAQDG
jgi:alkylated DNA repair dioxygenase AlkB